MPSLLAQVVLAYMVHLLLVAYGQDINFADTLFVMLLVYVAAYIPVSVGSLGVREGILVVLLPVLGVAPHAALAAAALSRGMIYVYALFGGAWAVFRPDVFKKDRGREQTGALS